MWLTGRLFGLAGVTSNVDVPPDPANLKLLLAPPHIPPATVSPTTCSLKSSAKYEPVPGALGPFTSITMLLPSVTVVDAMLSLLVLTRPPVAFQLTFSVPPPQFVV